MISLRTYLILLAALAAERLYELSIARRNARRAFARGAVEAGRAHYRFMVAFHAAFLVSCAIEATVRSTAPGAWIQTGALALAIAAQGLRYWAVAALGERWNTRIIVWPDAQPITSGPYRFIRHPNYAAVVIEMFAVPVIAGAWFTAIVFSAGNALLLSVRVRAEERALGGEYARAFAGRGRFIPGITRGT